MNAAAKKPGKLPAQFTPRLSNICVANNGNLASKNDPKKVFAAMDDAATTR